MPTPKLSRAKAQAAVDLVNLHGGDISAAARAARMADGTFRNRLRRAEAYGLIGAPRPVQDGFEIRSRSYQYDGQGNLRGESIHARAEPGEVYRTPEGHTVKGYSTLVDAEGRTVQQWVKTTAQQQALEETIGEIKAAFEEFRGAAPDVAPPAEVETDKLTVYALADWHIGLLAWAPEAGEDYDLKIARDEIMPRMLRLVDRCPPTRQCVILGLGDMLHVDGYEPVTARSRNVLDVDGRYPKVLRTATRMLLELIRRAAEKHEQVEVRILPGNHDDQSAYAITNGLGLLFEAQERVTVDDSPSRFWWRRFDKVFLGATHGEKLKMKDLPLVMAHDRPDDWAASTYRRIYTGHVHHESAIEDGGVLVTSMRSPAARDAYHASSKYRSGRTVYADVYDLDGGSSETIRVNL